MQSNFDFHFFFNFLISSGERIPLIYNWMINSVWSDSAFKSIEIKNYFEDGEKQILKFEYSNINLCSRYL